MPTGIYERSEKEKERLRTMVVAIGYDHRIKKGERVSRNTEFKKGLVPWNKDKPFPQVAGEKNCMKRPEVRERVSLSCKGRFMPSGDKHPQWKGGKTPLIMKIRNHKQSIEWRMAVFERDGYTCKICGDKRGRNLNAHHYTQLADIIHTLKIETLEQALNTPILWAISNGITLCADCHVIANKASRLIKQIYGGNYER